MPISAQEFEQELQQAIAQRENLSQAGFSGLNDPLFQIRSATAREEQPIISGASSLEKFLDVINTPQQFLFGLLNKRPNEAFGEAAVRGTRENLRFQDVLERNRLAEGPAATALGFAGDILFDPALLVAGPAFKLVGKTLGVGTRLGIGAGKRILGPTISDKLFQSAIKPIARRFSKTAFASPVERDLLNLIDFEIGKAQNARRTILLEEGAAREIAVKLGGKAGLPAEEVLPQIARQIEAKTGIQIGLAFPAGGIGVPQAQGVLVNILKDLRKLESFQVLQSLDDKIIERALRKQGIVKPTPTQIAITKEIARIDRQNSAFGILPKVQRRIKVKTDAQLAFPFGSLDESKKLGDKVPLFVSGSVSKEFSTIDDVLKASAAEKQLASVSPEIQRGIGLEVTHAKQRLENILAREKSFGLKTQRLEDSTVDYLTHLTTPEAKQAIAKLPNFRAFGRRFSGRHAFQLQRLLTENHPAIRKAIEAGGKADIRTLNRLWREGKLFPDLGPQGSNLFVDDPFAVAAVRRIRGEKAIADVQIITKAAANPKMAIPRGSAPSHFRELRLPDDPRLEGLKNFTDRVRFDPLVAEHLERVLEKTLLPEGLDVFLKTFDTVQGIWKGLTLAPFPAYHTRNAVGNMWNNYLSGMGAGSVGFYKNALAFQRGRLPSVTLGGKTYSVDDLRRLMDDFGITGRNLRDVENLNRSTIKSLQQVSFTAEDIPGLGKIVQVGFKVGTKIEDNARIAHFFHKLDKGMEPIDAALSVKKYLFDYATGLTDFEQTVMRRIMPFYTWTRFNIPLQAQAVVQNPIPFVRLSEVVNTVRQKGIPFGAGEGFEERTARLRGGDRDLLPEFVREAVGIPVRIAASGDPEYFLLGGWLPAADLEVLGRSGGIVDKLAQLLSPFLKEPVEQAFNYDTFLKRKLEDFPGQKRKFLQVPIRRRLVKSLRNIRLLADADRLIRAVEREPEGFTPEQVSKIGTITRFIFGLKSFEVSPERGARRRLFQRRELIRQLRGAARRGDEPNVKTLREIIERNR
jgi:hypothetical protein